MAVALARAKILRNLNPNKYHILMLAEKIEPEINKWGIRKQPAVFSDGSSAVDAQHIPRLLDQLLTSWLQLTPQEIFQEFERIHPFADGNGRLGQILFNWKNGTLHDPIFAEEYMKK